MIKDESYNVRLLVPHVSSDVLDRSYRLMKDSFSESYNLINSFEEKASKLIDVKFALATNSGTSALHLSLLALHIGEGDEVLCSSSTFIAAGNAIKYVRATPIFVDSETDTLNMNPVLLESAIRDRIERTKVPPKAIIVAHSYGIPARINEICAIAKAYDIKVVEDAAGALGSKIDGKSVGAFGDIGIFSFNHNKVVTTGGGGLLVSSSKSLVDYARFLANQAKTTKSEFIHDDIGFNYLMHPFAAALGICQLPDLTDRISRKRDIFRLYTAKIGDCFDTIGEIDNSFYNRWVSIILCKEKSKADRVIKSLENNRIEYRRGWLPLYKQIRFEKCVRYGTEVSDFIYDRLICLPSSVTISNDEVDYVSSCLRSID